MSKDRFRYLKTHREVIQLPRPWVNLTLGLGRRKESPDVYVHSQSVPAKTTQGTGAIPLINDT